MKTRNALLAKLRKDTPVKFDESRLPLAKAGETTPPR